MTRLVQSVETWDLSDIGGAWAEAQEPQPLPSLPGYRIEAELGKGAMSHVYRAFDARRELRCALKVGRSSEPNEVRRVVVEAELQGQLCHPAIPRVSGRGCLADGRPYLIQTLVPGAQNLDEAAQNAPWRRRLRWLAQAAEALAAAHDRCVIHGDVKPANLLVDEGGRLFVIDWGVSRLTACTPCERSAPSRTPSQSSHMQECQRCVEGTLAYMPSEQLRGRPVPASDVYALGVVLYEILCSRHPLAHVLDDADRTIQAILDGRLRPVPEDLPAPCRVLLERSLDLEPSARPTSAQLARELRRAAG